MTAGSAATEIESPAAETHTSQRVVSFCGGVGSIDNCIVDQGDQHPTEGKRMLGRAHLCKGITSRPQRTTPAVGITRLADLTAKLHQGLIQVTRLGAIGGQVVDERLSRCP